MSVYSIKKVHQSKFTKKKSLINVELWVIIFKNVLGSTGKKASGFLSVPQEKKWIKKRLLILVKRCLQTFLKMSVRNRNYEFVSFLQMRKSKRMLTRCREFFLLSISVVFEAGTKRCIGFCWYFVLWHKNSSWYNLL